MAENANIQEIYSRLNGAAPYHPYSAETFSDWSTEGGDIVTIYKEGRAYQVPVHESTLNWRGRAEIDLAATGNKERDPISRISKQKFAGGYGGISSAEKLYTFEVNQDHLLYDVYDRDGLLHGCLEMTASKLRVAFENLAEGLGSYVELTASHLEIEFWGLYDGLGSRLEMTRSHLEIEFWGLYDGLESYVELTRSHLQIEFRGLYDGLESNLEFTRSKLAVTITDNYAGLKSFVQQTASSINQSVTDSYNRLSSGIIQTASSITSRVDDWYNKLDSKITQTASSITQTVNDNYNKLKSGIVQTASSITQTVTDNYNKLSSGIVQTSSSITQTVNDNYNKLSSGIVQTSSSISQTVANNYAALKSGIVQTSSSINQTVENNYAALKSGIVQTSSSITQTVESNYAALKSGIVQTSSSIQQTVENNYTRLSSGITQTSSSINATVSGISDRVGTIEGSSLWQTKDTITSVVGQYVVSREYKHDANGQLIPDGQGGYVMEDVLTVKNGTNFKVYRDGVKSEVVSNGTVLSAINQSSESVTIQASKINLTGYVTAQSFNAEKARVDNLVSGQSAFTQIVTAGLSASSFKLAGSNITTKSVTIDGTTIHYLGW